VSYRRAAFEGSMLRAQQAITSKLSQEEHLSLEVLRNGQSVLSGP
jgi:hypothetical protein